MRMWRGAISSSNPLVLLAGFVSLGVLSFGLAIHCLLSEPVIRLTAVGELIQFGGGPLFVLACLLYARSVSGGVVRRSFSPAWLLTLPCLTLFIWLAVLGMGSVASNIREFRCANGKALFGKSTIICLGSGPAVARPAGRFVLPGHYTPYVQRPSAPHVHEGALPPAR